MIPLELSDKELLQFAIDSGIIDSNTIRKQIEMNERKRYLEKHTFSKIWNGNNGKWYTYVYDTKEEKRRLVKRNSREEIDDFLVEWYKTEEKNNEVITIDKYFPIWVERQRQCGRSDSTVKKYESDYERFFAKDGKITKKDITKITETDVEDFIFRLLGRLSLKKPAFRQMFYMLNGIFKKAKQDRIIKENPCDYIDIEVYSQRCEKQEFDQSKRVLDEDGCNHLMEILQKDRAKKPDYIPSYAVELALLTGMRAGELAFLQWNHIKTKDGYIDVCGSEKLNQKTKEYYDSETKTHKTRRIPLTTEMNEFFRNLKLVEMQYGYLGKYVFSNENGRIHRNTLCSCARNKCMQAGLDAKGLQVARRTFNSKLKTNGVSTVVAASILGHSEEVNEKFYTYDVSNMEYKASVVESINRDLCANKKRQA